MNKDRALYDPIVCCSAPTNRGTSCRNSVNWDGQKCWRHRESNNGLQPTETASKGIKEWTEDIRSAVFAVESMKAQHEKALAHLVEIKDGFMAYLGTLEE